jgi:dienelactone hydrolase
MEPAMRLPAAVVFALCAMGAGDLRAQTIEVFPSRVLVDEPAAIRASGLDPSERIAIHAELSDGAGHAWAAHAEFTADAAGSVDVSKQAPVAGSYKGVSAMGLVWSMLPAEKDAAMYQPPRNLGPQIIRFQLLRKGREVSSAQLEQAAIGDGVERTTVHEGSLRGVFFAPAGVAQHPGVLVVGGSNGGVPVRPAAWLASHGYAALALAYFRYDDLPAKLEGIPLEYFQSALEWMSRRPEILAGKLAVSGTSRGGELALQLGSMFPAIHAVVAYVPSNTRRPACCGGNAVPYAWTWRGQPLPFLPLGAGPLSDLAPRAAIEVERAKGPILMISGEEDGVWRSWMMAGMVVSRLKAARFPYEVVSLKYADAGHSAGRPDITPAWHAGVRQPLSGREMDLGGSPQGDAESSLDAMPKVLEFLRRNLLEAR